MKRVPPSDLETPEDAGRSLGDYGSPKDKIVEAELRAIRDRLRNTNL